MIADTGKAKCAMCGKPADDGYRPFCSKRCADLDLAHWLGERYSIPAVETPDDDPVPSSDRDDE